MPDGRRTYSIGTLVTDWDQHAAMKDSFIANGFDGSEFLHIDNTGATQTCAYRGLNQLLNQATSEFVLLVHQDVRLFDDDKTALDQRLEDLDQRDSLWAVAGNAGGIAPGSLAIRITDPHGADQHIGRLPQRVETLDENFLIVRRDARIGFSANLSGFHFYGADICLMAAMAGYTAYVIDFHLAHLSAGNKSNDFYELQSAFKAKWNAALRSRWLQTTCALVRLSGSSGQNFASQWIEKPVGSLSRRLNKASGWK
jgi:hypothetical protein